ncbi:MAG: hypothetical protein ACI3YW_05270, partial [Candidatus Egerieousia sp.]
RLLAKPEYSSPPDEVCCWQGRRGEEPSGRYCWQGRRDGAPSGRCCWPEFPAGRQCGSIGK